METIVPLLLHIVLKRSFPVCGYSKCIPDQIKIKNNIFCIISSRSEIPKDTGNGLTLARMRLIIENLVLSSVSSSAQGRAMAPVAPPFLQNPTCRGGSVGPPSRSTPDGPRASREKRACCAQWEEADGIQFYGSRSTGGLRGQVKCPNLVTGDGDLADAIKPTKTSESLSKWLRS